MMTVSSQPGRPPLPPLGSASAYTSPVKVLRSQVAVVPLMVAPSASMILPGKVTDRFISSIMAVGSMPSKGLFGSAAPSSVPVVVTVMGFVIDSTMLPASFLVNMGSSDSSVSFTSAYSSGVTLSMMSRAPT